MVSIIKRGKTFQYTVSNIVNGKQKHIRKSGFRSKKEALFAGMEIEQKIKKGELFSTQKNIFYEYFVEWFSLYKKNVAKATYKHYEYTASSIASYFEVKYLEDITRKDFQNFLNILGEGKSKETVSKIKQHISSFVKDAIEDRVLQVDFTQNTVIYFTLEAKAPNEKHLNVAETEQLLDALYGYLTHGLSYAMILLALVTGLRYEEIVGLKKPDFDFKNNKLSIQRTWGYNNRMPKGEGPLKNKNSRRILKVSPRVMAAIKPIVEQANNKHDLVFYSNQSKYEVISNNTVNKSLKKLTKELGITPITAHGMRHTHASILLTKGIKIIYVSKRLGHKNIATTYKHYAHLTTEMHEEDEALSVEVFDEM